MSDCRTCKFNTYLGTVDDWVSCMHPTTLAKTPRFEAGDPAWVNFMTSDARVSQLCNIRECTAYEAGRAALSVQKDKGQ